MKEFLARKDIVISVKRIRNRCTWCNGTGLVLHTTYWNHYQHPRNTTEHRSAYHDSCDNQRSPVHDRGIGIGNVRPCDGSRNRICA